METHRKTLLHLLKERAYKKGKFTLSSGKESEHYINCKPVTLSCERADLYWHPNPSQRSESHELCAGTILPPQRR